MTNDTPDSPAGGSFRSPSFEHAWVADAMRPGVFSCPAETSVRTVAQMMAQHHIHSVVVTGLDSEQPWGIVSDVDLLRAADAGALDESAGTIAATEFLAVDTEERLVDAAQKMASHEVTHLVVCEKSGHPVGVISTLDIAGMIAWGQA